LEFFIRRLSAPNTIVIVHTGEHNLADTAEMLKSGYRTGLIRPGDNRIIYAGPGYDFSTIPVSDIVYLRDLTERYEGKHPTFHYVFLAVEKRDLPAVNVFIGLWQAQAGPRPNITGGVSPKEAEELLDAPGLACEVRAYVAQVLPGFH